MKLALLRIGWSAGPPFASWPQRQTPHLLRSSAHRRTKGIAMAGNATNPYRELAYRANNGVEVVLFWQQDTDDLTVTVSEESSGAHFKLAAAPDQALDVFNHPYAHAAFRGLPHADASLPVWAEAVAHHGCAITDRSEEPTG
jgi:hypothetical protein